MAPNTVLLHPSVTERFTRTAPGLSGVARRTLRTNLRFIGRRVVPQLYSADLPLPRERSKQPYSPAQIAGFLVLADAQPTAARRMRAAGLVCLGAGAGLIRGDLREVRGGDVACRSGGVVVAFQTAVLTLVPPALTQLEPQHPALRVEVTELDPEAALPALIAGEFDLVLGEEYPGHPLPRPRETERHDLLTDELRLITPAGWRERSLPSLASRPFVMEPAGTTAREWATAGLRWLGARSNSPHMARVAAGQVAGGS